MKISRVVQRVLSLVLVLLIQYCNSQKDDRYLGTTKPHHSSDEVWINIGSEVQSMDPNKIGGMTEISVLSNMFVRLTQSDQKSGELIPDLAKSWEISKDGLEYTFHLREDAKWSDGQPVTAQDVEYSWKRLIDPKTEGLMSSLTDVIKNARAFRTGLKKESDVAIKAIDDHTLWVKLETPIAYFLGIIESVVFAPLPKHTIEKFRKENREADWVKPENVVVSGPFRLTEDHFKQFKIFEKNPLYYDVDKVRLHKVKTIIIEDQNADINAYITGQHDWSCCGTFPNSRIQELKSKKDFFQSPFFSTYFLMVNVNQKPLDNPLVRKALSLAIDRESIVKNILRAGQQPTRDFVPVGTKGYDGIGSEIYNVDLAKKLFRDAGFPDGKGFPKIIYKLNSGEVHKNIAQAIQEMWKKNLNVSIELVNEEWAVFMQSQSSGNYQIMRRSWIGDYLDPHSFLSVLLSDSTTNRSGWKNKEYDRLIELSNIERDDKKRFEYFKKAEKILADEQPYIPLYYFTRPYVKKPYLKGFWPNLQGRHEWKYMWIDERWQSGIPQNPDIADEPW